MSRKADRQARIQKIKGAITQFFWRVVQNTNLVSIDMERNELVTQEKRYGIYGPVRPFGKLSFKAGPKYVTLSDGRRIELNTL